jgi:hypothetical protein
MIVIKPDWKAVQKRFMVFCAVLFVVPVLFLLAIIFSQRQDIQNDPPYGLVAVAFCVAFLGSLYCGWVFRSRRITFDGKRLSYRKYCFTLKSIPVEELSSVEFISGSKLLIINRQMVFPCAFFPEEEINLLLEKLSFVKECGKSSYTK